MAQIGGWNVNKISGVNLPATAEKVAPAGPLGVTKQHIIYGFDLTFNGTPGTPVLAQSICRTPRQTRCFGKAMSGKAW